MMFRVMPAGSIVYRARSAMDPTHHLQANECGDTGKVGLYFSDYKLLCVGMALEYQIDIHLCTYKTVRPVVLYDGKYCFRDINPERYFKDGEFQIGVDMIEEENINHFDQEAIPIYENAEETHRGQSENLFGEIFINSGELDSLELLEVEELSLQECRTMVE
jgi:hypothetical protein